MLVGGGRLIPEGRGRGSRYRVPRRVAVDVVPGVVSLGELTADVRVEVGIPLSGEGESIQREVRAPWVEPAPEPRPSPLAMQKLKEKN